MLSSVVSKPAAQCVLVAENTSKMKVSGNGGCEQGRASFCSSMRSWCALWGGKWGEKLGNKGRLKGLCLCCLLRSWERGNVSRSYRTAKGVDRVNVELTLKSSKIKTSDHWAS